MNQKVFDILINLSSVTMDKYPQMLMVMSDSDILELINWSKERIKHDHGQMASNLLKFCQNEMSQRREDRIDSILKG